MSSSVSLSASNLGKCYHIYDQPRDRLMQMLFRGRKPFFREFWALRDVSFEMTKGEVVGIVGRNGSGKSTLLQLVCGTVAPTTGQVATQGRVAALLELGSGFNPEFTGLENVFLNARILGLTRDEIQERLDQILAFADIGEFVHHPVKTYSSGMAIRLAFAVSACVDPDLLIVDEALSVGDVFFQTKCFRRFESLIANGTTILFASHNVEQVVRHCSRALLLQNGELVAAGVPRSIVNVYLDSLFGRTLRDEAASEMVPSETGADPPSNHALLNGVFEERSGYNKNEYRWGDGTARIRDFVLTRDPGMDHRVHFNSGDEMTLMLKTEFLSDCAAPIFGLIIKSPDGITVYGNNSRDMEGGPLLYPVSAGAWVLVVFKIRLFLGQGDYLLSVGIAGNDGTEIVPKDRRYDAIHIQVYNSSKSFGMTELGLVCSVDGIGAAAEAAQPVSIRK